MRCCPSAYVRLLCVLTTPDCVELAISRDVMVGIGISILPRQYRGAPLICNRRLGASVPKAPMCLAPARQNVAFAGHEPRRCGTEGLPSSEKCNGAKTTCGNAER